MVLWTAFFATSGLALFWLFEPGWMYFALFGSLFQTLSIFFAGIQAKMEKGSETISYNTIKMYTVVYGSRMSGMCICSAYIPVVRMDVDSYADYAYQFSEVSGFLMTVALLVYFACLQWRHVEDAFPTLAMVVFAIVLGIFFNMGRCTNWIGDIVWQTAVYLEMFAMWPQVRLLQWRLAMDKPLAGVFDGHFIVFSLLSRAMMMMFWFHSYKFLFHDGNQNAAHVNFTGKLILVITIMQMVLLVDIVRFMLRDARADWNPKACLGGIGLRISMFFQGRDFSNAIVSDESQNSAFII